MGIKVVYYTVQDGRLLFGSEIRSILAVLPEKPTIEPLAISSFLRYRYTPAPDTILKGIKKLPAGGRLVVEEGDLPSIEQWWKFAPQPFDPMPSDHEAQAELSSLYSKALERHLISDVPVGLLLSGGIDSALLLALMSRIKGSWKTYSAGYGSGFVDDELRDAAETARILGATNIQIQMDRAEFEASLQKVVSALEEPVATSSIIPMYYLCRRAREDVTVALIGQGPDELFGGYKRHLGVYYGQCWRNLPEAVKTCLRPLLRTTGHSEAVRRAEYSLEVEDRLTRYQQVFSILPGNSVRTLFHDGILGGADAVPQLWRELWPLMGGTDELGGLQFLEVRSSLPDELLLYADKLSMAHSLELRVPYLDNEIVEYVERLNASFKIRHGTRKWLHRRIAQQMLPTKVLRRKKRGFATNVVDGWLRSSVSQTMEAIFRDGQSLIYNYLNPMVVRGLLDEHKAGKADYHKILFSMVVLEYSLREYSRHEPASMAHRECLAMQRARSKGFAVGQRAILSP
jgi:asparagine synthase (glutamine-hydrolysing)